MRPTREPKASKAAKPDHFAQATQARQREGVYSIPEAALWLARRHPGPPAKIASLYPNYVEAMVQAINAGHLKPVDALLWRARTPWQRPLKEAGAFFEKVFILAADVNALERSRGSTLQPLPVGDAAATASAAELERQAFPQLIAIAELVAGKKSDPIAIRTALESLRAGIKRLRIGVRHVDEPHVPIGGRSPMDMEWVVGCVWWEDANRLLSEYLRVDVRVDGPTAPASGASVAEDHPAPGAGEASAAATAEVPQPEEPARRSRGTASSRRVAWKRILFEKIADIEAAARHGASKGLQAIAWLKKNGGKRITSEGENDQLVWLDDDGTKHTVTQKTVENALAEARKTPD